MTEQEMLARMVPPAGHRPSKPYRGGVIQVRVTRACDQACFGCLQGSQLGGRTDFMSPEQFEQAILSLKNYWGVIGVFGGNPAVSKYFVDYCGILRRLVPKEQCGLWCNDILTEEKAAAARLAFNPGYSNLNCHMNRGAYDRFKKWWPESGPFGLDRDSRHSPAFISMMDVLKAVCPACGGLGDNNEINADSAKSFKTCPECGDSGKVYDEEAARPLIADCDVNQKWSAAIILFRGQLRAFFCEVAAAQASLFEGDPDYPDTGLPIVDEDGDVLRATNDMLWWQLPMGAFTHQVKQHCHRCSVPLRGHGELAMAGDEGVEQTSREYERVFRTKRRGRRIELVTTREQLGQPLDRMTNYLGNAKK